jgi:3'(2'), 5'-bisphosphate nucleotidase
MALNSYPVLLRLISSSVAIANGAGRIIREVMNKGELGIIEKGVNDPQTEADRRAQHCIISNLSRQFPSLKIIGEEDAYLSGKEQDEMVIDDHDARILDLKCPDELKQITEEEVTFIL